uniref:Radial spoke head protein 9 homolog n=1 Tax=Hemiselmis tepida TaxID=464990 RepID=A0A7S0V383_9CRYP|mmetsp:Transcript_10360/g.26871  ORF Transcript_10360/g.26871 Transcript_10360/m.26871 type:complete len:308 (+) Transcript_10360:33-956(+)
MDADTLSLSSDLMATASGYCLTTEERACLPPSLSILKNEHGFARVVYWGKIQGQTGDYLIAQGLGSVAHDKREASNLAGGDHTTPDFFKGMKMIPKRTFRLGPDGVSWTLLPTVDEAVTAKWLGWRDWLKGKGRIFTPFTGDPAHKFTYTPPPPAEGGEAAEAYVLEEERLACVVDEIDQACSVVPQGAYMLQSGQQVAPNPYYKGLSLQQGTDMGSYLHLRKPEVLPTKPISELAGLSKTTDFLDRIGDDLPKGAWSLKHDTPNNIIVIRSLAFPGYAFFSVVGSNVFGSAYVGTGLRNWDLAFML